MRNYKNHHLTNGDFATPLLSPPPYTFIKDEYYGMTYIPSSGRDSWSAYRISDEQLDDNDDLVYNSAKRDHDVMKAVNKQIVSLAIMVNNMGHDSLCHMTFILP